MGEKVKTTVELADELLREIKIRAARSGRSMKDVMDELLRRGLHATASEHSTDPVRVEVPLVECRHQAAVEDELTPERVAALLLAGDVERLGE